MRLPAYNAYEDVPAIARKRGQTLQYRDVGQSLNI